MKNDSAPLPRYTPWQAISVAVALGMRALEELRALKAAPPVTRFPAVRLWQDGVHYEGDVVASKGSTYQAARDTAREPPHDDWTLIAIAGTAGAHGKDAPVGEVCGRYDRARTYRALDLVAHDGGEWRAKHDDPGELPGPGWALSATQGRRGERGPRGERGERGPAISIAEWAIEGYRAVPIMSDGTAGPALDLREFFERYHDEARR